jgi:hypothetical protein
MQKIYSVIVTHEAEVHENFLFTNKEKAIAKMEEIKNEWIAKNEQEKDFQIEKFDEKGCAKANFTPQYATKMGYGYQYGEWEYGYVELIECVVEN